MPKYPVFGEGLDRLRTLYSVLAGLPGEQVNLNLFYTSKEFDTRSRYMVQQALSTEHRCGTIACAGGWAAVYPPFNALGLGPNPLSSIAFGSKTNYDALAEFFGMSYSDTADVFGIRNIQSEFTEGVDLLRASQRRIALHRIRLYLLEKGAIDKKRSAELARAELIQERGYWAGRA